jgi:hypothetical protein
LARRAEKPLELGVARLVLQRAPAAVDPSGHLAGHGLGGKFVADALFVDKGLARLLHGSEQVRPRMQGHGAQQQDRPNGAQHEEGPPGAYPRPGVQGVQDGLDVGVAPLGPDRKLFTAPVAPSAT